MMLKFRKSLAHAAMALGLFGAASEARADVACPFNISAVWIDSAGNIVTTLNSVAASSYQVTWWYCNVGGSTSVNNGYGPVTVSSDACKGLFSTLLTARSSGRSMTFWFHGPANCQQASLPADGTNPNPYPTEFMF
jgi:hypothetical protein